MERWREVREDNHTSCWRCWREGRAIGRERERGMRGESGCRGPCDRSAEQLRQLFPVFVVTPSGVWPGARPSWPGALEPGPGCRRCKTPGPVPKEGPCPRGARAQEGPKHKGGPVFNGGPWPRGAPTLNVSEFNI